MGKHLIAEWGKQADEPGRVGWVGGAGSSGEDGGEEEGGAEGGEEDRSRQW